MKRIGHRSAAFVMTALLALSVSVRAESPDKSFARIWQGRHVIVKQPLFALVFNERGRLGNTRRNRHEGLVVVTPFKGMYFQFDGRDSEEDISGNNIDGIVASVTERYRRSSKLEMGNYQKIEPLFVARHEPGVELVVSDVRVTPDTVRFFFMDGDGGAEPATSITVKWPVPLSKSLSERDAIERLMTQLVALK